MYKASPLPSFAKTELVKSSCFAAANCKTTTWKQGNTSVGGSNWRGTGSATLQKQSGTDSYLRTVWGQLVSAPPHLWPLSQNGGYFSCGVFSARFQLERKHACEPFAGIYIHRLINVSKPDGFLLGSVRVHTKTSCWLARNFVVWWKLSALLR